MCRYKSSNVYKVEKDLSSMGGGSYVFIIESYDNTGNKKTVTLAPITLSGTAELPETEKERSVTAAFIAPSCIEQSVQEVFDASISSGASGIKSYDWDFGDSTTASGSKVTKGFANTGKYKVKLTVTDVNGNYDTFEKEITVQSRAKIGTVNVKVVDEKGSAVSAAIVNFAPEDGETISYVTQSNGKITFKASEGRARVIALKQTGSNYDWSVAQNITVVGEKETNVEIVLYKELYTTSINVRRMTLSEILAAGLSVSDPANNNYYTGVIQFRYGGVIYTGEYIRNDKTIIDVKWPNLPTVGRKGNYRPQPKVVYIPNEQGAELLGIINVPFSLGYLKDFYCVQFTIFNNGTSDYTLKDNSIVLNYDSGLQLVSDASGYESSRAASLPNIPGGAYASAVWCLKGEEVGTHSISVSGTGVVDVFGKQFPATYKTEPVSVTVKKMSETIKMVVEAPDDLFMQLREDDDIVLKRKNLAGSVSLGDYSADMYFNAGMKNISNEELYAPSVDITPDDITATLRSNGTAVAGDIKAENTATFVVGIGGTRTPVSDDTSTLVLKPGETLLKYYRVRFNNADGLSYKTILARLSGIVLAQVSDPEVHLETNVDDSLFSLYYYGKLYSKHVHSFKLIRGTEGKACVYKCPCGYAYEQGFTDNLDFVADSKAQKKLKELGFDLTKVLENVTFEGGKIVGPQISVLGKDFNLFEFNTSV